jgi:hypothetical protein
MPITTLPIGNGFYVSDSLPLSAQECVNWYPQLIEAPALSQSVLLGTPGLEWIDSSGTLNQVNRGGWVIDGIPYFVNGVMLYRLNRTFVNENEVLALESMGDIEGDGRVSMADNGNQLCILNPGGKGYIFEPGADTLTEITDSDFRANGNPQQVVFLDGYFVFTTDGKKFIVSSLNDGLNYNALDFGTAEADPDDIVAPVVLRNQLFIGGASTLEAFQNIGGADFPFQRSGLFIQKGVGAPFTIIEANDAILFIGGGKNESPAIWALKGNTVEKVSTIAIDTLLQSFSDTEIAETFTYSYAQKGAYFVAFSLPTTTLVFDTINGLWHERKSQVVDAKGKTVTVRSRVNSLVTAYGRVLVGDSLDGRIGRLDTDIYTEYDDPIVRRVSTQPFQNNMQSFSVPMIELTMEAGVGDTSVPNPQVRMERSKDGKTWTDSRTRHIGRIGEYDKRTIWRRNGRVPRFELFRFTLSDAVKPVILQLTADIVG